MFNVTYRKTTRDNFENLGVANSTQWYTATDAALYADAISGFCIYAAVIDADTKREVYDATSGEWLDS